MCAVYGGTSQITRLPTESECAHLGVDSFMHAHCSLRLSSQSSDLLWSAVTCGLASTVVQENNTSSPVVVFVCRLLL